MLSEKHVVRAHLQVVDLVACKALCARHTGCAGVEFDGKSFNCELQLEEVTGAQVGARPLALGPRLLGSTRLSPFAERKQL